MRDSADARDWTNAVVGTAIVLAVLALFFRSTAAAAVEVWKRDPFGHSYILVLVVVYLVWIRRHEIAATRPQPQLVGSVFLIVSAACWFLAHAASTHIIEQLALLAMAVSAVWMLLGSATTNALIFPLSSLALTLPWTDALVPALQTVTAQIAVTLLRAAHIPAYLEGHIVSSPGQAWEIAAACGGINYVVASLALGYIYAGCIYRSWRLRIGFLLAAFCAPILANGARVFVTIFVGSLGHVDVARGLEHNLVGILVFLCMAAVLLTTCGRWHEPAVQQGTIVRTVVSSAGWSKHGRWVVVGTTMVLVITSAAGSAIEARKRFLATQGPAKPVVTIEPDWLERPTPIRWGSLDTSDRSGAATVIRSFQLHRGIVTLKLDYFSCLGEDATIGAIVNPLTESPWAVSEDAYVTVTVGDRLRLVRRTRSRLASDTVTSWRWYLVDHVGTERQGFARLLLARARLLRHDALFMVITVVSASDDIRASAADSLLQSFLDDLRISSS